MQSSIVHKLLGLLTVISEAQKPMTFSELVEATGLNKSTVHRLLAISAEEQMVHYDDHRKVYSLGPRVFDWVRNAYSGYDIQAIALDEMIRLFDLFDANVTIGIPSGLEVVYLRILESQHSPGGAQRPGMREPMHCSASGKALLAYLPDEVIRSKVRGYHFERFTDHTIDNATDFEAELAVVRQHGFGRNDREQYDHLVGISAPIFNYLAEPIAVLNIWSVYPRHTINDLTGWSDQLKASASHVTKMIGGIMPDTPKSIAS